MVPVLESKLVSLVALLAVLYSLTSIAYSSSFHSSPSLPCIPKLLCLSCGLELLLLVAYALFSSDGQNAALRFTGLEDALVPMLEGVQQSSKGPKLGTSTTALADAQDVSQSQHSRSSPAAQNHHKAPSGWWKLLPGGSGRPAVNSWSLLWAAALLSTAAGNIFLRLLTELRPYAWSQLGLLEVIAMGMVISWTRRGGSCAKSVSTESSRACLALLLLAVCLGQGVVGWAPALPVTDADEEDERLLQYGHIIAAAPPTRPTMVVLLAALAALCSSLASQILQHRPHPQPKQHGVQLAVHLKHCGGVLVCNFLLYLCTESEPFDWPFEDVTALHWHGVVVLAIASILSTQLASWPASTQLLSKGYAYQGAMVITAACSSWLLQAQAPHGMWQATQFACSSLVAGAALLLLHTSMQDPENSKAAPVQRSWRAAVAWLKRQELLRRLQWCWNKEVLLGVWAATALLWLLLADWGKSGCSPQLSFSYAASTPAMAQLGITPALLSARSDAPFPGDIFQLSNHTGAAATGRAGTNVSAVTAALHAAAGASAASWRFCPALTCSTDPSCSPSNSTCCAHLLQHMLAFWDAFMHGLGLHEHYVMLHDTLMDAAYKGALRADVHVAQTGVSAAALTVLERPCVKEALWQHGYVLFLQGSSWRLCAHRDHPLPAFRRLMHPVRHMTAATAATYVDLDVVWQYQQQEAPATAETPSMQEAVARNLVSWMAPESTWWLCSSDEVLASAPGYRVTMSGLQLPRPIDTVQHLSNSPASSSGTRPARTRAGQPVAVCQQLIAELLGRMKW